MTETVLTGPLLLAAPIAVLAGVVSFLSPCVLPLVPGYLGYVTGLSGVDLAEQRRGRMVAGAGLFVLGFSVVFVLIGFTAGTLGSLLLEWGDVVTRVLGVVVIALGLVFAGAVPAMERSRSLRTRPAAGLAGAPLLGIVFGIGWLPCVGPTLAAITLLSVGSGTGSRGVALAVAYCIGLGLPFLVVALAFRRAMGALEVVRRHRRAVQRAGGAMLVVVGLLLVSGLWDRMIAQLQGPIADFAPVL